MARTERRAKVKALGRGVTTHPVFKRMSANLRRYGKQAAEVYRMDGDTPEEHVFFDVFSMRRWAAEHAEECRMPLDWGRVERLITSGAVDPEHIRDHTIRTELAPIIVARHASEAGDQIVDGAHRYVALALGAASAGLKGAPIPIPVYALEPVQWRRFVIPHHIARALRFDEAFAP